ncbi:DNA-protecting protein DprA [Xylanimonas allomyrinae]|uniref:DNA-protecting protein DprA n=1 Tax=Xylanimonas allomyrinae TaxID=2509459 RepID=A0A4P6EPR4_9MICO|nr:DNA-processing protein DprA [Xylanimonas allomyrinae]QAY62257.1 DNA-protecting protein DprA [Xylanimonas allomyrinae]
MTALAFDADDPALAAAAWSRIAEPGDETAGALVAHLGAPGALAWLLEQHAAGATGQKGLARALASGVARWSTRLDGLDPRRELQVIERAGGTLLLPQDERWPRGLDALGAAAPFALWVRGDADLAGACRRSVAVVGARASTSYGEHVTAQLAAGLVDRGFTVVSGGAYGIDAVAHRAALLAAGTTVAVMAGGVDRFYPQGNHDLLRRVAESGAVVAEVPPGSSPFRQRFLARNRLIAAMTAATVVVEAAWRSGALSTARRAADLLRPVGAVPGPVTSMASGGCHLLLRDGVATCVTDAAEVAELAGAAGDDAARAPVGAASVADGLDEAARAVLDALPARASAEAGSLARVAGRSLPEVLGALGVLELRGLVAADGARWRRALGRR